MLAPIMLVVGREEVIVFKQTMQRQCPHGTIAVSHWLVRQTGQMCIYDADDVDCAVTVGGAMDAVAVVVLVVVAGAAAVVALAALLVEEIIRLLGPY